MPKASDQENRTTRERIVDATLAEIIERGWGGVRSRSVAHRAGVNNALIHYHFGSMENLRVEAAAAAFGRLAAMFSPEAPADTGVADAVTTLAGEIADVPMDDPIWYVLMEAFLQAPREPRVAELANGLLGGYRTALTALIADSQTAGTLPADLDAEGLAVALTAMLDGLALHAYIDRDLDVSRAGEAAAATLRLLATSPKKKRKEGT